MCSISSFLTTVSLNLLYLLKHSFHLHLVSSLLRSLPPSSSLRASYPPSLPPSSSQAVRGTFSSITGMQFSPIRPGIFAAGSAEGLLYLYDISSPLSTPVAVLEASATHDESTQSQTGKRGGSGSHRRAGITGISFNRRQRDLIAACDAEGKVHIWRLSWGLYHATQEEGDYLRSLNNNSQDEDANR